MAANPSQHGHSDPKHVSCFVLTVSDSRRPENDESGRIILESLKGEGHQVVGYAVVKDDPSVVASTLKKAIMEVHPDIAIVNGGTGISKRDSTFEALEGLMTKKIPGFGELFRALSFEEIGPAAMLSRASAGIHRSSVIFSIPGSPKAVRLAMERLLLPQVSHIVGELRRAG